jgi:hypothetical protein
MWPIPPFFKNVLNRNSLGGAAGLGGEMSLGPGLMRRPPMNAGNGVRQHLWYRY